MAVKGPLAGVSGRRYWTGVAAYIVLLLVTQSVMGLGIDKFKELWGVEALGVVAYFIVFAGAAGVLWTGWKVWARCSVAERAWIGVALLLYGVGTFNARNPQERLHYLGYWDNICRRRARTHRPSPSRRHTRHRNGFSDSTAPRP